MRDCKRRDRSARFDYRRDQQPGGRFGTRYQRFTEHILPNCGAEGELVEIDCRPSDAVALAVTARVPIFVSEEVLGEALEDDESEGEEEE